MRGAILTGMTALGLAVMAIATFVSSASALSLLDKIRNGDTIRIGYSNDAPWAFPGENKEPLGLQNVIALEVLKKLGVSKVESVVTEWGSLVPGLQAGRFDIITDGMYILPERCRNVLFTEPVASIPAGMAVTKGNPKGLHSYQDVRDKGMTFVTGVGYRAVKNAQEVGIPDEKIMQVAGNVEIVQAIKAGRADAGVGDYLGIKQAISNEDGLEMADPFAQYEKPGYPAFAFRLDESMAVEAINAQLKDYLGSEEMMKSVSKYGYNKSTLPDGSKTTNLCKY
ncbi:ectoine/hydroxyectoine ABC transporter substrate-binding protein EhuB [Mesorhizobium sp. WSM3882]|uniref:ectoine/hydroxyectoine ABC transporter substrate-binding protein EhuB n=1 Tax=Mesorhizobium sp. WSM3882 TaxID=2029407 RepID=UPI001FD9A556|nr:ectoine/hydroxyectoine ABC transporter substrate-binding protein EhuB [Mesorhizobium sp. WSM3882]